MPGIVEEIVCGKPAEAPVPRVIGGMVPEPPHCVEAEIKRYLGVNLGDHESHPEIGEMVQRVVSFASMASLGRPVPGWVTSGATESNILALYLAREDGRRAVVYSTSAHYSIEKAARLLGMEQIRVNAIDGYAADLARLELVLEENPGSVVVATLGTTETGYLDPVVEIARVAARYDSVVHVDAAYAGVLLRWLPTPKARLQLDDTIRTLAVDMHKIPEAPIGVGVLLVSSDDLLERLWFDAPYLPSGRQFGLLGTRPAAPLAAAARIAEKLEPYMDRLVAALAEATRQAYERLVMDGPYASPHPPETPVICAVPPSLSGVLARLRRRGFRAYTCPSFRGVRLAVMPHTLGGALEVWVKLLLEAAA